MALIYITGAPGVGKSTLQKELATRGFETHDMDDPDLGGAHNIASGERVSIPPAMERVPEWFNQHEWRIAVQALEALKVKALNNDILVCGVAPSDNEVLHLFDKIIYLKLPDDRLKERLADRLDNDYGKNEFEVEQILMRKKAMDEKYQSLDVITLQASGSIGEVAEAIVNCL